MPARDLYPSDITEFERQEGFTVVAIANPDAQYSGHPPQIPAVVRTIESSHRIIKMRDPAGKVSYKFQRFGKDAEQKDWEEPGWYPFGDDYDTDPAVAAENAAERLIASRADQGFICHLPPHELPTDHA